MLDAFHEQRSTSTLSLLIPTSGCTTMRVLALGLEPQDTEPPTIREVARVDVTALAASGYGIGKLMSARHDHRDPKPRPFTGQRLANAVSNPFRPDILVSARTGIAARLPAGMVSGLPWIVVLPAWRRLRPMVPAALQEVSWDHVTDDFVPKPSPSRLEREAWLTAMTLRRLLAYATPAELVALSTELD